MIYLKFLNNLNLVYFSSSTAVISQSQSSPTAALLVTNAAEIDFPPFSGKEGRLLYLQISL